MEGLVRRVYIVEGRVQGVGFRLHVLDIALDLGVKGSVANLPDGTVRIDAQGRADVLEQFVGVLMRPRWPIHPQAIRVREELPVDPGLTKFSISRSGT